MTGWVFSPEPHDEPGTPDPDGSPAEQLRVGVEMRDATTIVTVRGPVCAYTCHHLAHELERLVELGRHQLTIDASGVCTLTSHGVEVLERLDERLRAMGGSLVVRPRSAISDRVLSLCGWAARRDVIRPAAGAT